MRIVLAMVGIALGLAIAVVAGVYGWQQYEATKTVDSSAAPSTPSTPPSTSASASSDAPKPVNVPAPKAAPAGAAPGPTSPLAPVSPPKPAISSAAPKDAGTTPATAVPTVPPQAPQSTPGADTPIAVPEKPNVATPEKLNQLVLGMTEDDVAATIGAEGVATPEEELGAYTPEGWFEVRWPNPDGSYIAGLFTDQGLLAHVEPFNMPGAYEWLATPWYAVPKWLNDRMRANNMPVRVPAVDVIQAQANTFQFRGALANADGIVVGSVSGNYYTNDPGGRFARAMEGTYEYSMANGAHDANTFQFTE